MTDWMLKKKRPLAAGFIAAGTLCLANQVHSAESDTFMVVAELAQALSLSCNNELSFGKIYRYTGMGLNDGVVTVDAENGGIAEATTPSNRIATVSGGNSVTCNAIGVEGVVGITLSSDDADFDEGVLEGVTLSRTGGGTLSANVFSDVYSLEENGPFYIGGVLTVSGGGGTNADGIYESEEITVTLTVD